MLDVFEFEHKNKGGNNKQSNKQKKNNVLGCSYVYVDDTNTEQFTTKEDQEITFTYTDEIVM